MKWKYADLLFFPRDGHPVWYCDQIAPALVEKFMPAIKKQEWEWGGYKVWFKKEFYNDALKRTLLDYLGSLGWEAYAHDGNTYYFKQPVEE